MMFDIDHFKQVNDRYGHPAGDEVLRELAERALHNVRSVDLVGRLGGEEFVVVMPETNLGGADDRRRPRSALAVAEEPFTRRDRRKAAGHDQHRLAITGAARRYARSPAEARR